MAQNLKYKRFTVNVPLHLAKAILQRIPEVGYQSESAYFIGLALYDLWCRRPHKMTLKVMQEPPVIRDGSIDRIATDYLDGKTGKLDACYFERYLNEIIEAEIAKYAEAQAKLKAEEEEKAEKTPTPTKKDPAKPKKTVKGKKS